MKVSVRYGIILGFISVLLATLVYLGGVEMAINTWISITISLGLIGAALFFSFRIKKEIQFLVAH